MKRMAFTLAEVLITLTIIGIIATLTIPTLMQKYEKEQTVVKLKKAYNLVNNAVKMSVAENGPTDNWPEIYSADVVDKYIVPYFKVVETATMSDTKKKAGGRYYDLSGDVDNDLCILSGACGGKVIKLADGTEIWLQYTTNNSIKWIATNFYIDINGYKKPNTFGKDIFGIRLYKSSGKVVMHSACDSDTEYTSRTLQELKSNMCGGIAKYGCAKNMRGLWCGALIQAQGWQITDDYPW